MKLSASAQNVFSFSSTLPMPGHWSQGARRRPAFQIKPFTLGVNQPSLAQQDELEHKQETICAVILGLCFLSTLVTCLSQLMPS